MIREHFTKRLELSVPVAFGGFGSDHIKQQAKGNLAKAIMYVCDSTDEPDMVEALPMRDILTPDKSTGANNGCSAGQCIMSSGFHGQTSFKTVARRVTFKAQSTSTSERSKKVNSRFSMLGSALVRLKFYGGCVPQRAILQDPKHIYSILFGGRSRFSVSVCPSVIAEVG